MAFVEETRGATFNALGAEQDGLAFGSGAFADLLMEGTLLGIPFDDMVPMAEPLTRLMSAEPPPLALQSPIELKASELVETAEHLAEEVEKPVEEVEEPVEAVEETVQEVQEGDGLREGSRYDSEKDATAATEAYVLGRFPNARMRRDNRQALPADQLRFVCNRTQQSSKCGAAIAFKRDGKQWCATAQTSPSDAHRVCKRIFESHKCSKWPSPVSTDAKHQAGPAPVESSESESSEEEEEESSESEPEPTVRPRRLPKGASSGLPQVGDIFLSPKPFRDILERFAKACRPSFSLSIDTGYDSQAQSVTVACAYDKGRTHPCPWHIVLLKESNDTPWCVRPPPASDAHRQVEELHAKHDHRVSVPPGMQLPPTPRSPGAPPVVTSSRRVVKRKRMHSPAAPIAPPPKRAKPVKSSARSGRKQKDTIPTPEPSPRAAKAESPEGSASYFHGIDFRSSATASEVDTAQLSLAEYLERTIGTNEETSSMVALKLGEYGLSTTDTLMRLRGDEFGRVVDAAFPGNELFTTRIMLERLKPRLKP